MSVDDNDKLIESLERKLEAERFATMLIRKYMIHNRSGDDSAAEHFLPGALQRLTVTTLSVAPAYSWSPHTALAVVQAADTLPLDVTMSDFLTSGAESMSGWWYFSKAMNVCTAEDLSKENAPEVARASADRTIALLWKREPNGAWFTLFVNEDDVPIPTLAWRWEDGHTVPEMVANAVKYLKGAEPGRDPLPFDLAIDTIKFFSRFFAAGMTWLRQGIAVSEAAQVGRGPRRRLQREHDLTDIPQIKVIELRRRKYKSPEQCDTDGSVDWSHRWVVDGHWRNQWYRSRNVHAPKYIESYVKGPEDKPFVERLRVYSVNR